MTGVSHVYRDRTLGRPDVDYVGVVLDGEAERRAVPAQVFHPCRPWKTVDSRPGTAPEARVEPSLHRQARTAEVHSVQHLGGPQLAHARERLPDALISARLPVEHQHVVDALAAKRCGNGQARLAGADDDHGVDRSAVVRAHAVDPRSCRIGQQLQVPAGLHGKVGGSVGHAGSLSRRRAKSKESTCSTQATLVPWAPWVGKTGKLAPEPGCTA